MVEGRHPTLSPRLRQLSKPRSHKRRTFQKNEIKKNVNELITLDLLGIAKVLKKSSVSSLHLFQSYAELQKRIAENRNLGFLGYRHSEALFSFSKSLAWSLASGGWLQELELGFALWERDLKIIAESISQSTTLKRLSFANSELRDHGLQILGKSLQECAQLEILNLSACGLTDSISPLISAILKAHVSRRAQADWQGSLRSQKGVNGLTMKPKGLIALDLSLNYLSDSSIQTICTILRIGTPLEALNLRGNQITRMSGKMLLDVMEEWPVLRFIDLRDNVDNKLMGVLEDKQHFTTFTQHHPPFWTVSSLRQRRTQLKASVKKSRTLEDSLKKMSIRPQSSPIIRQDHVQPKKVHQKPPLIIQRSTTIHDKYRKEKKHMKRPSTCLTNDRHHLSSSSSSSISCSPDEFTAWDDNDSNSKENMLPFEMYGADQTSDMNDGCASEEFAWKQTMQKKPHKNPNFNRVQDKEELDRFCENFEPRFRPRERSKSGSRNLKHLELDSCRNYDEKGGVYEEFQRKDAHKSRMQALPSKKLTSSIVGNQTTSFLKEITQAILHLKERLDELIGHAEPEQAMSQFQVHCRG